MLKYLSRLAILSAMMSGPLAAAPLHDAVMAGDLQRVQGLLAGPADPSIYDARDPSGRTPLLLATETNQIALAKALIDAGADVNAKDHKQDSAYLLAGAQGRLEILKMTLSHGADLASTNRYGGTALIPAAERGHIEVVRTLIDAGVAVDHVNRLGWTALLEAILLSDGGPAHQEIVRLLVAAGADVNLPDRDGITPLQHAHQRGYVAISMLLEAAGAQ